MFSFTVSLISSNLVINSLVQTSGDRTGECWLPSARQRSPCPPRAATPDAEAPLCSRGERGGLGGCHLKVCVSHPPCSKQGEGMARDQLCPATETASSPQRSTAAVCGMSPPRRTATTGAARQWAEALPASFITQGEFKWAGSWPSAWENLSQD